MLLPSRTLAARVWTPALSQTKMPAASRINLGLLGFKPPVASCAFFFFAGSGLGLLHGGAQGRKSCSI